MSHSMSHVRRKREKILYSMSWDHDNEDAWGQLAAAKLGVIRQLEMADAIERINMTNDGFVDDALCVNEEILCGHKG